MPDRPSSRAVPASCAFVATVGLTLSLAAPASAALPQRTPVPSGLPFTYPAGEVCSFPIHVEEAEPSGLETVDFGGGRTVDVGPLVVRLTNESTGATVVRDVGGSVISKGDRSTFFGASIAGVYPGEDPQDLLPGEPGLVWVRGIFVLDDGVFTRVTGEVEDLCATLSGGA